MEGTLKKYFRIPDEILLNRELGKMRVALYSYLYIHKGLNDIVNFSVPLFLVWAGFKSDTHRGGLNDKVLGLLYSLIDMGYVSVEGEGKVTRTSTVEIEFNTNLVNAKCGSGERFAIVYLDEVENVMKFERENRKDTSLNSFSIILVFAYLRRCIPRRINKVKPEERSEERIRDRRKRCPEAYNGKYENIADTLGISARVVAKAVAVMRKLKLIVLGIPYRVKGIDGEYRTPDFIFANFQKRDDGKLVACGMEYAKKEVEAKARQMYEYHKQFGINYALQIIT